MKPADNGAREALAESLSVELDHDMDKEFMASIDRVQVRLFLFGFIVAPLPEPLSESALRQ